MKSMLNNIPKLIEWLKKYFQFTKSPKRNQLAALTTCSVSQMFFFLPLRVSYLVAEWLTAANEHEQITVRQTHPRTQGLRSP